MSWRRGYRNDPRYFQRSFQSAFTSGQGTRDEQVRWVQYALNRILNQNLPVDGVMSAATRTAVRDFQQRSGLPVTGYVGPDTQQALLEETSSAGRMGTDSGGDMTSAADAPGPDPGVDASGAAGGVVVGASPQNPIGADADARELLEEYGLPLGEFELESEFENWESGPHPGYSSFPVSPQSELEMEAAAPTSPRSTFALVRAIPDDPDYRKYIPIDYKLNAKKIIGELAQDVGSRGESAHTVVELAQAGIHLTEIFEIVAGIPTLAGGLAVAGPLLGVVAIGLGLGAPYYQLAQETAAKWAARGFSRGVVMGADKKSAKLVKYYFGNISIPPNHFFPNQPIAMANYRMGLLVGYVQGRMLSENQRAIFWRDLGHRMGDQSYRGPRERWNRRQLIDWYDSSANIFWRDHLDQ